MAFAARLRSVKMRPISSMSGANGWKCGCFNSNALAIVVAVFMAYDKMFCTTDAVGKRRAFGSMRSSFITALIKL